MEVVKCDSKEIIKKEKSEGQDWVLDWMEADVSLQSIVRK